MYDAITELMHDLSASIRVDENLAEEFGRLSSQAETRGANEFANALIAQGRTHRVNLITLHAKLGALVEAYGSLHLEQP